MSALDIFYKICEIPHSSKNTKELKSFIIDFASKYDYKINCDKAGNIHILKGKPKLILQAHYDMVLIGSKIIPFIKDNKLFAKNSSLGADNGAAVAAILDLASKCSNFEALLTNDEEIGMLGAKNLNLDIKSKTMINLDSEDINEICIGCAGGFDADIKLNGFEKDCNKKYIYEIKSINFCGGHSGIDINKNIPNAIIELLWTMQEIKDFDIIELSGGEKRNSIPVNAKAIIATNKKLDNLNLQNFTIQRLNSNFAKAYDKTMIKEFLKLHNGVYIIENDSVISSLNFSIIKNNILNLMIRANREIYINRHMQNLKNLFGKSVKISSIYKPWEKTDSNILKTMQNIYQKHKLQYKMIEIHAGLECGILKEKYNLEEIISIGPTIKNPHSKNEMMCLNSFEKFQIILNDLIR
ncbi:M20/M25/M40 family metallo-hydrolase [Helicobacter sp. MIT 14-3879]|uniref:M20/M25/M40 family metallo-hydrolase n=1 Tax=Helicobacter sp. MIT 14-3879 TaxID=2040649 RepID=UPI000E1E6433|nr:M20/M25/M40 family metallo-hydrolase [Helicobacter sp. MIT 14-3879]RDU65538.1 peptidase [Helicobacter sp. MIT 14-3879]